MTDEEKGQLGAILEIVQSMQGNIVDLQEDVEFMKENMVTKAEAQETESRLMGHIDGLAMRTEKFDHELIAAQSKFNRIEERVEVLELKAGVSV